MQLFSFTDDISIFVLAVYHWWHKKSRVHFPAFCFDQVNSSSHLPRSNAGFLWFFIGLVGFCTFFGLPDDFYLDDT